MKSCRLIVNDPADDYNQGQSEPIKVAVKVIDDANEFKNERMVLEKIQSLNHRHLVKHIATCERDSEYYVIFPLATGGSLWSYWKEKNKETRTPERVAWCLQQMAGLADALYALHSGFEGNLHVRHGDLKPGNILVFEDKEGKTLAIADMGISRLHTQPTDQRPHGTMTTATTRAYEAPEAAGYNEGGTGPARHRIYDTWSLGCIFLEFVIWLLFNFESVENFSQNRGRHRHNPHCSYYQFMDNGTPDIEDAVNKAITALLEDSRCKGTPLETLIHFIKQKALVIEPVDRCTAKEMFEELVKIVQNTEDVKSLSKIGERRSDCPAIFTHLPQQFHQP